MLLESTLVALPNLNQINYALIRRLSDLQHGVRAVCAHTPKINWYSRANPGKGQPVGFQTQHSDNIAMSFNSKVMGTNHKLQRSDIQRLIGPENQHANTIVFGADVGHPGSGLMAGIPSVACVVASSDVECQNYPGSMRLQAGGQEVSATVWALGYMTQVPSHLSLTPG
jgi:eukaryotic translation initiation factor 2C